MILHHLDTSLREINDSIVHLHDQLESSIPRLQSVAVSSVMTKKFQRVRQQEADVKLVQAEVNIRSHCYFNDLSALSFISCVIFGTVLYDL